MPVAHVLLLSAACKVLEVSFRKRYFPHISISSMGDSVVLQPQHGYGEGEDVQS